MVTAPSAVVMVRGGPEEGKMIFLSGGVTKFGRDSTNEVVVNDQGVSREHAAIRGDADGYWISDLGSRNGTYVNGERLGPEPHKLQNKDVIQLGGVDNDVRWVFTRSMDTQIGPSPYHSPEAPT